MFLAACVSTPPPRTVAENDIDEDYSADSREWKELAAQLPSAPQPGDLVSFYVSPATSYRFGIDKKSIAIGSDDVIRYTLVGASPSGAKNVSYEGIRCETIEKKTYAIGRADGTWAPSRNAGWERIHEANANRQHAALIKDVFCPDRIMPKDAKEILSRLSRQAR